MQAQAGGKGGVKFEVVFGVSDSTWALYDLEHGRQVIDYHPQDKSGRRAGGLTHSLNLKEKLVNMDVLIIGGTRYMGRIVVAEIA